MSGNTWSIREEKDREGTWRRRQLVDAARTVFEHKGYGPATVSDITKEAGVSRPTFYVYFASKEDVFSVIAEEVRDAFRDAQRFNDLDPDDIDAVLTVTVESTFQLAIDHIALISILDHQALSDPDIRALCTSIRTRGIQRTTRYLEGQVAKGTLELSVEPHALAMMGWSMNERYAAQVVFGEIERETAIDHMMQVWAAVTDRPQLARMRADDVSRHHQN